jgi:hypothetical protein
MPNDIHYHGDEIGRKVALVIENPRLSPVDRKHLEDVIYTHLPAILGESREHNPICPVCKGQLTDNGKCPKRHEEGHTIKRNNQDRSIPSG